MEVPLPIEFDTPKDDEDSGLKSYSNIINKSNNEENNTTINDDKNKVDALRKSLSQDIDELKKTLPDFYHKVKNTFAAMDKVGNMIKQLEQTANDIKIRTLSWMENQYKEDILKTNEKSNPIKLVISMIQHIDIIPNICIDSFFRVTKDATCDLTKIKDNIKNRDEELEQKYGNWYNTNIPLSVNYEELKDIKKKILEIKSNMTDFAYRINAFIMQHYYSSGQKIIEKIKRIDKFNLDIRQNRNLVNLNINSIKQPLVNIVNYIFNNIKCFAVYYPENGFESYLF